MSCVSYLVVAGSMFSCYADAHYLRALVVCVEKCADSSRSVNWPFVLSTSQLTNTRNNVINGHVQCLVLTRPYIAQVDFELHKLDHL